MIQSQHANARETGLSVDGWRALQLTAAMRLLFILAVGTLCLAGCRHPVTAQNPDAKVQPKPSRSAARNTRANNPGRQIVRQQPPPRVTPLNEYSGRIASVNLGLKFVVLEFQIGSLPPLDTRMGVFRQGQKVAELKVTGPAREQNIAADIVAGEAQLGDEVRGD